MYKKTIDPVLIEFLKPIIRNTTILYNRNLHNHQLPIFARMNSSESEQEKIVKDECVHMIFTEDGGVDNILEKSDRPGYNKCPVCNKYVPLKFDDQHVLDLKTAAEIHQQLAYFSITLNLPVEIVKTLIAVKSLDRGMIQICSNLNEYMKYDSTNAETMDQLAAEYTNDSFTSWV